MSTEWIWSLVGERAWRELRETPVEQLQGRDGLIDVSMYMLGTTTQLLIDGTPVFFPQPGISLTQLAFSVPQVGLAAERLGRDEWSVGHDGPRLVAERRENDIELSIFAPSAPIHPDPPIPPFKTIRTSLSEFVEGGDRCGERALDELREGMTGPLADVLEGWLEHCERWTREWEHGLH